MNSRRGFRLASCCGSPEVLFRRRRRNMSDNMLIFRCFKVRRASIVLDGDKMKQRNSLQSTQLEIHSYYVSVRFALC